MYNCIISVSSFNLSILRNLFLQYSEKNIRSNSELIFEITKAQRKKQELEKINTNLRVIILETPVNFLYSYFCGLNTLLYVMFS